MSEARDPIIHPASASLPDMSPDCFDSLKRSIQKSGLIDPIVLWRGEVIDGRHRLRACNETGVDPRFVSIPDDANPWTHALDRNERRDLTEAQRYGWWEIACEQQARFIEQSVVAEKKAAISEAAKAGKVGRAAAKEESLDVGDTHPTSKPDPAAQGEHKTRQAKAKAAKVSPETVKQMEALKESRPDLHTAVIAGRLKLTAATRQMRDDKKKADLVTPVSVEVQGLLHGDFRLLAQSIPDASVELVFTDPPYDRGALDAFEDAAREAARILKPGGSFIAYCGHIQLPEVLNRCANHLRYWWVNACVHGGGKSRMREYGITVGWKPMVWFVKGHRGDKQTFVEDTVTAGTEKSHHEWQQAESEARYYIERLSSSGGVVVDFFAGGGTTLVAAAELGRRWVGFEISAKHYASAAARINGVMKQAA